MPSLRHQSPGFLNIAQGDPSQLLTFAFIVRSVNSVTTDRGLMDWRISIFAQTSRLCVFALSFAYWICPSRDFRPRWAHGCQIPADDQRPKGQPALSAEAARPFEVHETRRASAGKRKKRIAEARRCGNAETGLNAKKQRRKGRTKPKAVNGESWKAGSEF